MDETENRPNPEELLKAIKAEQSLTGKGELKIFLGMAAGVGKTYAMLSEARTLQREGVDVLIGIVETHGRQETASMIADLPSIPEKRILYRGLEFRELDIEEILKRKPKVVLVDELAHSNVPGSKHSKRWQDVLDILDAGIDVLTTLNVQHIESLNDVVASITEISIRETVPDSIIERASSIHLVDLTPKGLLERLREGKVYTGNQSQIAIEHFFQQDTLTALREVVLRYAADKVDRDLRQMISTDERATEWKTRDKIVVGVTGHPFSQKLIRIARKLAFNIDAPWIALHVNDGSALSESEANTLEKNLAMARDLGAEVVSVNDPDIVSAFKKVIKQRGITQVILGVERSKQILGLFSRQTLYDRLLEESAEVDIHTIKKESDSDKERSSLLSAFSKDNFVSYVLITVPILLLTLFNFFLIPSIHYRVTGSIFLVGILGLSLVFKKGPVIYASILFAFLWVLLFVPPVYTLYINETSDFVLLALYFVTGLTSGILIDRAREHREMLTKTQESTQILYEIVKQIANSPNTEESLKFLRERLPIIIDGDYDFLIDKGAKTLSLNNHPLLSDDKDKNAALWAFENGKEAGWGTDTLPSAKNLFLPLKAFHNIVGLMVYHPHTNKKISLEEKTFLYTVCQQLANDLERKITQEKAKQNEYYVKMEEIQKKIFDQFIEAFQLPLEQSKEALSSLKKQIHEEYKEMGILETSHEIIKQILENITTIIQINEGMLPLKTVDINVETLLRECCATLETPALEHQLNLKIEKDLPLVPCDEYLLEVLICNLILNAVKHSPPGTSIDIEAKIEDKYFVLSVSDKGKGITDAALETLYQKFTRLSEELTSGIGFSLSVAKTIAEIHNGKLIAENNPDGGGKFTLYLPLGS